MKKVYAVILCVAIAGVARLAYAGAYEDLEGMRNTGVSFDGSDGERSGMDINVSPSYGNIPDVPAPTPVETYQPEPAPEPEPVPVPEPVYQPEPAPEPPQQPAETRSGTEVAE